MKNGIKINSSAGIRAPCQTCNERNAECHRICNKYKLYRTILNHLQHKREKRYEETNFILDVKRKIITKQMKSAQDKQRRKKR